MINKPDPTGSPAMPTGTDGARESERTMPPRLTPITPRSTEDPARTDPALTPEEARAWLLAEIRDQYQRVFSWAMTFQKVDEPDTVNALLNLTSLANYVHSLAPDDSHLVLLGHASLVDESEGLHPCSWLPAVLQPHQLTDEQLSGFIDQWVLALAHALDWEPGC